MSDLQSFEESLITSRNEFIENHNQNVQRAQEQFGKHRVSAKKIELPQQEPNETPKQAKRKPHTGVAYKTGYVIKLAVRKQKISLLDELFEYHSPKISKLEARIDAEKAAKIAGYPIIGHVHSIEKL